MPDQLKLALQSNVGLQGVRALDLALQTTKKGGPASGARFPKHCRSTAR